jgi:hypothetical protein
MYRYLLKYVNLVIIQMGCNVNVTPCLCSSIAQGLERGTPYLYLGKFVRTRLRCQKAIRLYAHGVICKAFRTAFHTALRTTRITLCITFCTILLK